MWWGKYGGVMWWRVMWGEVMWCGVKWLGKYGGGNVVA